MSKKITLPDSFYNLLYHAATTEVEHNTPSALANFDKPPTHQNNKADTSVTPPDTPEEKGHNSTS